MYNYKINEACVCKGCGAFFQAGWPSPEGPSAWQESTSYLQATKVGLLREKVASLKRAGNEELLDLLGVLHPDLVQPAPAKKTPCQVFRGPQGFHGCPEEE